MFIVFQGAFMRQLLSVSLACALLGVSARAETDPIRAKLDADRAKYEVDLKEIRQAVMDSLDQREAAARDEGNKKLVDQIKAERQAYLESDEWPPAAQYKTLQLTVAARSRMSAAFKSAIQAYTKARMDNEANQVEKELDLFRREIWQQMNIEAATVEDDYVRLRPESSIWSKKEVTGPFEMVVMARTELQNIRLRAFSGSCVIFNWELNMRQLRVCRPDGKEVESGSVATARLTPLQPNTWYVLRWRVTQFGTAVFVNDQLVFRELRPNNLNGKGSVSVASANSKVDVRWARILNNPGNVD